MTTGGFSDRVHVHARRSGPGVDGSQPFADAITFFGEAESRGECSETLTFIGPSGTSHNLVPGDFEKLAGLTRTDEFREMFTKAIFALSDLSHEIGSSGEGVQEYMTRWAKVGGGLALM